MNTIANPHPNPWRRVFRLAVHAESQPRRIPLNLLFYSVRTLAKVLSPNHGDTEPRSFIHFSLSVYVTQWFKKELVIILGY